MDENKKNNISTPTVETPRSEKKKYYYPEAMKKYRAKNIEKMREYDRLYKQKMRNPDGIPKKRGRPFKKITTE